MRKSLRRLDALAIVMALLWGQADYWLIAPHPDASGLRRAAVVVRAVMAMAVFIWAIRERQNLRRLASGPRASEPDRTSP